MHVDGNLQLDKRILRTFETKFRVFVKSEKAAKTQVSFEKLCKATDYVDLVGFQLSGFLQ